MTSYDPSFDKLGVEPIVFSPDSQHIAYIAIQGDKQLVVKDGKPGPAYYVSKAPIFSPDSQHLAYMAGQGGKDFVVVDGKPGPNYNTIDLLVFSPDSRVAYIALQENNWFITVDENLIPVTGAISGYAKLVFDSQNILHLFADVWRDKTLYCVEQTITQKP